MPFKINSRKDTAMAETIGTITGAIGAKMVDREIAVAGAMHVQRTIALCKPWGSTVEMYWRG